MSFRSEDERCLSPYGSWRDIVRLVVSVAIISGIVWCVCQALILSIGLTTNWMFDEAGTSPSLHGSLMIVGVLLLGGIVRALLLRRPGWPVTVDNGINVAVQNYAQSARRGEGGVSERLQRPTFALALKKSLATFLTIGTGGSGGLASPLILISESVGAGWAKIAGVRSSEELRVCQLSGIAAAVTTLLGAPFAGALFATESVYRNQVAYSKFAYCLFAGVLAYGLGQFFFPLTPTYFLPAERTTFGWLEYCITTLVAIFVSVPVAVGFSRVMARLRSVSRRIPVPARALVGSLVTGVVAIALWNALDMHPRLVLGSGQGITESVFFGQDPQLQVWWFLLAVVVGRMLTTALTLVGSGSVGLLLPAIIFGGLSGAAVTEFLQATGLLATVDPKLPVVVGIASALVAVIRVPLAAVALSIEVWSPAYAPAAALACATTIVIMSRTRSTYQSLSDPGSGEPPSEALRVDE